MRVFWSPMLTDQQFERVRRLSLDLTGIELGDRHRDLIASRCRRFRIRVGHGLDTLLAASESGDPEARQSLIGLLTTNYTGFFRNPGHFDIAARHAMGAMARRGHARLWSAAAATGEEPYSLAMALITAAGREDPPAAILATDINQQVLEAARQGEYGELALKSLPPVQLERFFGAPGEDGRRRIADAPRRLVEFQPLNLADERWTIDGTFDVIFCRNLLMYLERRKRTAILHRLSALLAPDGILILDPAEHLGEAHLLFGPGNQGVYPRRPAGELQRKVRMS